jgi:hypothetical protein
MTSLAESLDSPLPPDDCVSCRFRDDFGQPLYSSQCVTCRDCFTQKKREEELEEEEEGKKNKRKAIGRLLRSMSMGCIGVVGPGKRRLSMLGSIFGR